MCSLTNKKQLFWKYCKKSAIYRPNMSLEFIFGHKKLASGDHLSLVYRACEHKVLNVKLSMLAKKSNSQGQIRPLLRVNTFIFSVGRMKMAVKIETVKCCVYIE